MSDWAGFLAPSWVWLFLLLIPLLIVYFLKLKRPRLEIPSLVLWRSVINDQRVNSPFQRFKRHLLLWLQLLILCSLILAVMQPFFRGGPDSSENLPVLIDCSASMAARSTEDGPTRLDLARKQVEELIERALPNRICLVAVDSTARRLTEFTNNKRILRNALSKLEVRDVPSNLEDGLRMAEALARRTRVSTTVLISDGNFSRQDDASRGEPIATVDVELPFELRYDRLPKAGPNVGIIAFNARRQLAIGSDGDNSTWNVFVRVSGSSTVATSGEVILVQADEEIDRLPVSLDAGESQRLVFQVETSGSSNLAARIEPNGFDSLQSDNEAFLDLPMTRHLLVWCDSDLESFRHALEPLPGVTIFSSTDEAGQPDMFDLAITTSLPGSHSDVEASLYLVIGQVPSDLTTMISIEEGEAEVVDWQRGSRLLEHVGLANIQIAENPTRAAGVRDQEFRERGYEILATGNAGPLVLARRSPTRSAYFLLFHTDHSTLPYRIGFPVLVKNSIDIALNEVGLAEVRGQATQILRARTLNADQEYRVTGPRGIDRQVHTDADGVLSGIPAPYVGRYRILDGGQEVASVGAAILSATESSLTSAVEIVPRDKELAVSASSQPIDTDRPLWPTLAMIAFVVLLIEWWYFHKKAAGITA